MANLFRRNDNGKFIGRLTMYDFIFIIYYRMLSRSKDNDPLDSTINLMTLVTFFHVFLLHNTVTFFANRNLLALAFGKDHGKIYYLPFVILFMALIYWFYKRRSQMIVAKYSERQNILSIVSILYVLIMTVGPLLLGIHLLNRY